MKGGTYRITKFGINGRPDNVLSRLKRSPHLLNSSKQVRRFDNRMKLACELEHII